MSGKSEIKHLDVVAECEDLLRLSKKPEGYRYLRHRRPINRARELALWLAKRNKYLPDRDQFPLTADLIAKVRNE